MLVIHVIDRASYSLDTEIFPAACWPAGPAQALPVAPLTRRKLDPRRSTWTLL